MAQRTPSLAQTTKAQCLRGEIAVLRSAVDEQFAQLDAAGTDPSKIRRATLRISLALDDLRGPVDQLHALALDMEAEAKPEPLSPVLTYVNPNAGAPL